MFEHVSVITVMTIGWRDVYIDADSFAFLEFKFRMSPKGLRYWSLGAAKKLILRLAAIRIDMLQDSSRITYRKHGDKYYLNHAQGNALWRVVGGRDHFELDPLRMKYNYIVTGDRSWCVWCI